MDNRILYTTKHDTCIFKLIGQIRYMMGTAFNEAIEEVFKDGNIKVFIIDMTDTTYIDSTNLGLVAKISRYTYDRKYSMPVIVSSNDEVTDVMKSMGFEQAFYIVGNLNIDEECCFCTISGQKSQELKNTMLEAHEILMDMNERNRNKFKNVVDLLKKSS